MANSRSVSAVLLALILALVLQEGTVVQASSYGFLEGLRNGLLTMVELEPTDSAKDEAAAESMQNTAVKDTIITAKDELIGTLVMAKVDKALNVRKDANITASKVGKLYKNGGGIILERKNGWTKIESGNLVGWASDEYLLFGIDALVLAHNVGRSTAMVEADKTAVKYEPAENTGVYATVEAGSVFEVVGQDFINGWVCVEYGEDRGYILTKDVLIETEVAHGETNAEIRARQAAEWEAKRHVKYDPYPADEATRTLLAAIIHCEARGESYEGQVAVGSVVMNRVRSKKHPNNIRDVIYAPGQFSPAMSGTLDKVLASGVINASCYKAADEVLSGVSNVLNYIYFRRKGTKSGYIIGNHVFY
jgi:uncharacterized protein YgiM (DUF1202 family)